MSESTESSFQGSQITFQISPTGDPQSPYFLHHTDHPRSVIINPKLTTTNYVAWSRSFLLALSIKNKMGFINGTIPKPQPTDPLYPSWIRYNNLTVAWMLDFITPQISSTIFYMDSAPDIWNILKQSFAQPDDTRKDIVFRFLNGLNDSFSTVGSQIILMDPIPSLDKVYSLVLREEAQRNLLFQAQPGLESSTMLTASDGKKKFKKDLVCSHCGKKVHLKKKCYRLVGFPEDFKFTKSKANSKRGRSIANNVTSMNEVESAVVQLDQEENSAGNGTMGIKLVYLPPVRVGKAWVSCCRLGRIKLEYLLPVRGDKAWLVATG
ncbi:Uncharacterized protein TCM_032521 [Theobroma cacao]|uniref:Retrotransposon Copia-like N-terminal domain-containing protein n=1 Tax=Theobroma cacao TaxID=3641 RepID=A0A061F9Y6_THECC|nr:Uncharacterized protein TCM_032521 [Theobroma cacao]